MVGILLLPGRQVSFAVTLHVPVSLFTSKEPWLTCLGSLARLGGRRCAACFLRCSSSCPEGFFLPPAPSRLRSSTPPRPSPSTAPLSPSPWPIGITTGTGTSHSLLGPGARRLPEQRRRDLLDGGRLPDRARRPGPQRPDPERRCERRWESRPPHRQHGER